MCARVHTEESENERNVELVGANTLDMFVIHFSTISPGTGIPFNALNPESVITTRIITQKVSALRNNETKFEKKFPCKQRSPG